VFMREKKHLIDIFIIFDLFQETYGMSFNLKNSWKFSQLDQKKFRIF
jgi:hypothetical protein